MNLSNFDGFLKDVYIGPPRDQMRKGTVLLAHIKRDMKNINASGRKAVIPIRLRQSQAIGGRADGGLLPTKTTGVKDQQEVSLKYLYGVLEVTGPTIRASRNDVGAFRRAVRDEMEDLTSSFKSDFNRQLHGTGNGRLALIASANDGTDTITVDGDEGTQYLRAGMRIDIVDGADGTSMTDGSAGANSAVISSITNSTTFVVDSHDLSGVDDDDIVVREDCVTDTGSRTANYQIQGIAAGIDNDTGTYMGISRNSYSEWMAQIVDGGSDTITTSDLRTMITKAEKFDAINPADVGKGHLLIVDYDIRDKIANILEADKTYPNTVQLAGGFKGISYRGLGIVPDADTMPNKLWLLNLKDWALYSTSEISWADDEGKVLKYMTGYDKYEAVLYWDVELACSRPYAQVGLENVTT